LDLLESTKEGRNINRHYYTKEEIAQEVERPIVKALLKLFTYRNQSEAFDLDGGIEVETPDEATIIIKRHNKAGSHVAQAEINLKALTYSVTENHQTVTFE
ncbi:sucrose phosphorylase, partial [Streptococcus ursoris]|nr:sucrose phosphorylase [Streptococcus ratti]